MTEYGEGTIKKSSGASYYRARYYDPTIGRFVSEDPIRFRTGIDFYSYVRNRPTGLRDPKGRVAWGGGACVSGMAGLLTIGGGVEGSCMIVGDTAGNTGLLCCAGLGGGYVAGGAVSGGVTTAICPTCATICDMEGGSVQGEGFGATGPGVAAATLMWSRSFGKLTGASSARLLLGPFPEELSEQSAWRWGRQCRYAFFAMILSMGIFALALWLHGG
jgi:RHS repeat-associated protein